jgi:glycosidase
MSSDGFDKHRHFAFLRDYEDHTLMIVANFSNREATMKLTLPQHAFDWMEIPVTENLHPGKIIEVTVPPFDAKVITLI